jgi:hypothetical protein
MQWDDGKEEEESSLQRGNDKKQTKWPALISIAAPICPVSGWMG